MAKITVQLNLNEFNNDLQGTKTYTFNERDILESFVLSDEYRNDLQEVATILASNLENVSDPKLNDDGTVLIEQQNFNDSYCDMVATLEGEEDDEDDQE